MLVLIIAPLIVGAMFYGLTRRALQALIVTLLGVGAYAYIGLWQIPASIRADAQRISKTNPYCIALPSEHRPVGSWLDLSILRTRGNSLTPHLMLWVTDDSGVNPYHWSYRHWGFFLGLPLGTTQNCTPRQKFLEPLRSVEPGFYLVRDDVTYVIPTKYESFHIEADYIYLRFGLGINARSDSVEFGKDSVIRWQKRQMENVKNVGVEQGIVRSNGPYGFDVWDLDPDGLPTSKFSCHTDGDCRIEFLSDFKLFSASLSPTNPEDRALIKAKIETIWQSFIVHE